MSIIGNADNKTGVHKALDAIVLDHSNEINLIANYGSNALAEVYVDNVPLEPQGAKLQDTIILKGDFLTLFGRIKI